MSTADFVCIFDSMRTHEGVELSVKSKSTKSMARGGSLFFAELDVDVRKLMPTMFDLDNDAHASTPPPMPVLSLEVNVVEDGWMKAAMVELCGGGRVV